MPAKLLTPLQHVILMAMYYREEVLGIEKSTTEEITETINTKMVGWEDMDDMERQVAFRKLCNLPSVDVH